MFNRLLVNLLSRWESFLRERAKWVTPRLTTAKWSVMEKSGSGRIIRLFMSLHQFSGISVRSHHHRKVEQWKCQWRCFYFSIRQDMHRVIQHELGWWHLYVFIKGGEFRRSNWNSNMKILSTHFTLLSIRFPAGESAPVPDIFRCNIFVLRSNGFARLLWS